MFISSDGKTLWGVERQREGGDLLKQFDLESNAQVVESEKTCMLLNANMPSLPYFPG